MRRAITFRNNDRVAELTRTSTVRRACGWKQATTSTDPVSGTRSSVEEVARGHDQQKCDGDDGCRRRKLHESGGGTGPLRTNYDTARSDGVS